MPKSLTLYFASWCPFCQAFLPTWRGRVPAFAIRGVEADISHPRDPRWDEHKIEVIPTVVLSENGAELARLEAKPGIGLSDAAFEGFLRQTGVIKA